MNNFENIDIVKKKFNWGAFLLTWIWGIFNKSYVTLIIIPLSLIPFIGILLHLGCAIYFGINGNRWAFENKKFNNIDEFLKYQRKFVQVAISIFVLGLAITCLVLFLTESGTNETILDIGAKILIIRYAMSIIIFLSIFPILYFISIKNMYKVILTMLVVILIGSFNVIPTLEFYGFKYLNSGKYDKALVVYNILSTISTKNTQFIKNRQYFESLGACYLGKKDIDNAILNYEKASKNVIYDFENETLSNLYIVNKDYDKAIKVGGKYKICALQNDWKCVLKETTNRIVNAKSRFQPLGETEFIPNDESAFSYRAVAYKNLGDLESAKKDYDMVFKLVQRKELQEGFKEFYNSNGLSYKQSIEKQRKLYNIE